MRERRQKVGQQVRTRVFAGIPRALPLLRPVPGRTGAAVQAQRDHLSAGKRRPLPLLHRRLRLDGRLPLLRSDRWRRRRLPFLRHFQRRENDSLRPVFCRRDKFLIPQQVALFRFEGHVLLRRQFLRRAASKQLREAGQPEPARGALLVLRRRFPRLLPDGQLLQHGPPEILQSSPLRLLHPHPGICRRREQLRVLCRGGRDGVLLPALPLRRG